MTDWLEIRNHALKKWLRHGLWLLLLALLPAFMLIKNVQAQGGGHTLYGDLKIDESKVTGQKPLSFDLILYTDSGLVAGRQSIPNQGRYRFLNLPNGWYDLVVEVEGKEVARLRVELASLYKNDFRRDIEMEWNPGPTVKGTAKSSTVSAADFYKREGANQKLFEKAGEAMRRQEYEQAVSLFTQLVDKDPKDFQAWTELGTLHFRKDRFADAESAYLHALKEHPDYLLALLNLGKLRMKQKKYEGSIEPLVQAVKVEPTSAEVNYLLGESYLQIKKGSQAVVYLNEALRLDPVGMAEVHLRLALLYDRAGMKERAAAEYEQFLAKKPNYPEKKKLQQYISENKKP
jgi:tetratricopeptide (TPR) repeat protein